MGVIFDLDRTLINSEAVISRRKQGQQYEVENLIPRIQPYPGITELLAELNGNRIPTCIVTSAPKYFCKAVVEHWGWKVDAMVCRYDTRRRKPRPDPVLEGLRRLGIDANNAVGVGNDIKDIIAYKEAGVMSLAALWGASAREQTIRSKPDIICETVGELAAFLRGHFRYTTNT